MKLPSERGILDVGYGKIDVLWTRPIWFIWQLVYRQRWFAFITQIYRREFIHRVPKKEDTPVKSQPIFKIVSLA